LRCSARKRKNLYKAAQETIYQELVYVPLWYENNWVIQSRDLTPYRIRPDAGFQGISSVSKPKKMITLNDP